MAGHVENLRRGRASEPMPAGSDLYLEAFTRWILAGKSDSDPAEQEQAARDKAHALGEMLDMAGVDIDREGRRGPARGSEAA